MRSGSDSAKTRQTAEASSRIFGLTCLPGRRAELLRVRQQQPERMMTAVQQLDALKVRVVQLEVFDLGIQGREGDRRTQPLARKAVVSDQRAHVRQHLLAEVPQVGGILLLREDHRVLV